jgi:hypothetical protein
MGNAPTGESIDARAVNVDRLADGEIVARSRQENRPVVDRYRTPSVSSVNAGSGSPNANPDGRYRLAEVPRSVFVTAAQHPSA